MISGSADLSKLIKLLQPSSDPVPTRKGVGYRTILTFMTRMARKGWLATAKRGNTNRYQAVVAEESAIEREIDRFLTEVVGSEPEHVQLLEEAVARHRRRARSRR